MQSLSCNRHHQEEEEKAQKKLPESSSIFDLKDDKAHQPILCVAAFTVTVGKVHQFVHWLAVSDKAFAQSKFSSWRGCGLVTLLLHAIICQKVLPLINKPSSFVMQCTVPTPAVADESTLLASSIAAGSTGTASPLLFYR
jgi:hypothetical protein